MAVCALYGIYALGIMAPAQRLVIWPLTKLFPGRRNRLIRRWLRWQALIPVWFARRLGNVGFHIRGEIPAEGCIVVMNHQSIMDIPLGVSLVRGPYPLMPVRERYIHGIPAMSPLMRLLQCPALSQSRVAKRAELRALLGAAARVRDGENSLLIFPEGHRTKDGAMQSFMAPGLRLMLQRAPERPVYCAVVDGMHHFRTFGDTVFRMANTRVDLVVLGPFQVPAEPELDAFITSLRERMVRTLADIRGVDVAEVDGALLAERAAQALPSPLEPPPV